jgi:hypothetical protein
MKIVIPAQAEMQKNGLDTGLRRYDERTFIGNPESAAIQSLPSFQNRTPFVLPSPRAPIPNAARSCEIMERWIIKVLAFRLLFFATDAAFLNFTAEAPLRLTHTNNHFIETVPSRCIFSAGLYTKAAGQCVVEAHAGGHHIGIS